jgi:hypothetical protein
MLSYLLFLIFIYGIPASAIWHLQKSVIYHDSTHNLLVRCMDEGAMLRKAGDRNTLPRKLEELSHLRIQGIARAVAGNPSADKYTLSRLSSSQDPEVRDSARKTLEEKLEASKRE